VFLYFRSGGNMTTIRDVADLSVERFPNSVPPSWQAIHNLNKRYEQTGLVADLPRSGRPKSVTTEENLNIIVQSFVQSPTKSTRKASSEHDILRKRNRRENRNIWDLNAFLSSDLWPTLYFKILHTFFLLLQSLKSLHFLYYYLQQQSKSLA
jgi:hypothetical protein